MTGAVADRMAGPQEPGATGVGVRTSEEVETAVARILLGSAPLDEASMGTLAVFQWATGRRALTPVTEVSTGPGAPGRAELAEENRAALRQLHDWKLDLGARYFASGAALALAWLLGHIEQP